jgi:hypothetical protein
MWDKIYSAWMESTVIQGVIALVCTGTICYLYITNQAVQKELVAIVFAILGYYFGSKKAQEG